MVCCALAFSQTAAFADMTQPGRVPSLGVTVVINAAAGITALTKAQVAGIFSGKITNWNQAGGANLPISVFVRGTAPIEATFEKVYMDGIPVSSAAATQG